MPLMKEVVTVLKKEDGVHVVWQKGDETKTEYFTFSELMDMKINASDLIDHPGDYQLGVEEHLISMKK